jgi:8-oxo-dGTP pyrophosphatase MutT (NUDIX family)
MANDEPRRGWRVLKSDYVIETPYLRLRRDRIELPSGQTIEDYFVRESRGFSVVFALTPDEHVVLVRQYKHGIGTGVLELPAGAIDEGESAAACARRELAEETGYVGDPPEPEHVRTFFTDPTNSDSRLHLFLIRRARPLLEQRLDVTEDIAVELAPLDDLRAVVRDGTIEVSAHVACIYLMLERLGRL